MSVLSVSALFAVLFVLGAVCAESEPYVNGPGYKCEPKATFQNDCNTCRCNDQGTFAACTFKACPPTKRETKDQHCEPNTTYTAEDGCNTCTCAPNGKVARCTLRACPSHTQKEKRQAKNRCVPNTTFLDDDGCNTCNCDASGYVLGCTLKFCGNSMSRYQRDTADTKKVCEPKSTFKAADGCNTCTCNAEGTNAACTLRACITKRETETKKVCEPGSTFLDEEQCNTCKCNEEGTFAACTLKLCTTTKIETAKLEKRKRRETDDVIVVPENTDSGNYKCTPGKKYKYRCNDCNCSEDGKLFCSRAICAVHKRSTDDVIVVPDNVDSADYKCEPGKKYKYRCNDCNCQDEGKLFCTRQICPSHQKRSTDEQTSTDDVITVTGDVTTYKCEQGKKYVYDCNKCRCLSDSKLACTRMQCPKKEKRSTEEKDGIIYVTGDVTQVQCETDKKYRYMCNDCNCIQGKLACTRKMCAPGETRRKREEEHKPKPKIGDPDYTCVPGSHFLDDEDCNDCTCASDGKNVACTDKLCGETIPKRKRDTNKPKIGDPDYTCTPGTSFLDDEECNTCTCAENGKDVFCTLKACITKPKHRRATDKPKIGDPNYTCTPGTSFLDDEGCNTCICADNGKNVRCTEKLCIKPKHRRATETCKAGETKEILCNTCTCEEGVGWVCPKKGCVTKPLSKREETGARVGGEFKATPCTPNDKFKVDCNTCHCNADGAGYSCTEIACSHSSQNP